VVNLIMGKHYWK